jgi:hypothetical protein
MERDQVRVYGRTDKEGAGGPACKHDSDIMPGINHEQDV